MVLQVCSLQSVVSALQLLLYLVPTRHVAVAAAHVADGAHTLHWTACCIVDVQKQLYGMGHCHGQH